MSSSFAASDIGLYYFDLLRDFGMTPTEWGALDAHERLFLETASVEWSKIEAENRKELEGSL